MSVELKVKSKHLSVEAQIIRFEERKLKRQAEYLRKRQAVDKAFAATNKFISLNQHRRWDVRNENRATFLARAYLAGKAYREVEQKRKRENEYTFSWHVTNRAVTMINKYGKRTIDRQAFLDWANGIL